MRAKEKQEIREREMRERSEDEREREIRGERERGRSGERSDPLQAKGLLRNAIGSPSTGGFEYRGLLEHPQDGIQKQCCWDRQRASQSDT